MADNYLENHYLDYLRRKEEWLKKKKKSALPTARKTKLRHDTDAKRKAANGLYNTIERPEDEAL